jgi:hypothetical protein
MSDANDKTETTPEDEGSDESQTPDPKVSTPDELSLARKRQAGAEAARQAAEAKAAEYERELAKYRQAAQTDEQKDLSEVARLQANLEAAERRAAEAEAKADARILDSRFPQAREKFPEITDEVRLAELQAFYAEEVEDTEPPAPLRHNEAKDQGKPATKAPTLEEIEARVLASPVPEGWS